MSPGRVIIAAARLCGIAVALFFALFALDAFRPGAPFGSALIEFVIHLLPAALLLVTVIAAWQRPWIGAVVFGAGGVFYAARMVARPDWVIVVSGPLILVGVLFLAAWRRQAVQSLQ